MNKIANRTTMCEVLLERAKRDRDVTVLCSDSRGSASMTSFAKELPDQFIEVGIAEQNLVGIAAGMASCGKKAYAISPASFLSTRSYEQAKVDCAYSGTNVKLIGISGGVSYGALGMTHHSAQDIAAMAAIPGMRVYLPSDHHQTRKLFEALLEDQQTAYVRLGRNPLDDIYTADNVPFEMDRATWLVKGEDVVLVACGEMVRPALDAAILLKDEGIACTVLDMYCVKPLDTAALLQATAAARLVVTVEEHAPYGGLGSLVSQVVAANTCCRVINLSLPDEPVVTGTSREVFEYYGLHADGIAATVRRTLER